jgi:hypothetical protein
LPGFKTTFLRYLAAVEDLSNEFTELVAEAFGLPSDGLAQFYGAHDRIQHRSKVRWSPTPQIMIMIIIVFVFVFVFEPRSSSTRREMRSILNRVLARTVMEGF